MTESRATMDPPVVEAKGLFHIYRETEVETVALRGADLDLGRGSWTSIMGPSGSGKSTLIQVLAGLLEPKGGSVRFDGYDVTRLSPGERARRRRTGIAFPPATSPCWPCSRPPRRSRPRSRRP